MTMVAPLFSLAALTLSAQTAYATYSSNLAFRSPYLNERSLEVDTRPIVRSALRKRQLPSIPSDPLAPVKAIWADEGYGKRFDEVDHAAAELLYGGGLYFTHGVASGDPYEDSIILWTRVIPAEPSVVDLPACVSYKVFSTPDLSGAAVASGQAFTAADIDWTVKVEAKGLSPQTLYWYQWYNCANPENKSPLGRTRTAPAKNASLATVGAQRFAVFSCAYYSNGFFNSYGGPVKNNDVDYVLHLGDYIYENPDQPSAKKINRSMVPAHEAATLEDYRLRYALYHTDPDLLENHRLFPWIAIWDDHELGDNDYKAGSTTSNDTAAGCAITGTCFTERAANAKRAYFEWMPIRQVDIGDQNRIWREFNFGNLIDLIALDTRKADRDVTDLKWNRDEVRDLAEATETTRTIMGATQRDWLFNTLDKSVAKGTKWRLLLNQVIFGSIDFASTNAFRTARDVAVQNYDAWDGYQAERHAILDRVYQKDMKNVVAITGDTHANWLFENNFDTVTYGNQQKPGAYHVKRKVGSYLRGQIVEFAISAISSGGWGSKFKTPQDADKTTGTRLVSSSGGLLWAEGFYRGYMNLQVSAEVLTATYFGYPDNQIKRTQNRIQLAKFTVKSGTNSVTRPLARPSSGTLKPGN